MPEVGIRDRKTPQPVGLHLAQPIMPTPAAPLFYGQEIERAGLPPGVPDDAGTYRGPSEQHAYGQLAAALHRHFDCDD